MASFGRDAKRTVILRGDLEMEMEKGGEMKEDIARKYSAYFRSILHHNNGYFLQVKVECGIEMQINNSSIFSFFSVSFSTLLLMFSTFT